MEKLTPEQLVQFEELINKKIGEPGSLERIRFEEALLRYKQDQKIAKYRKPNPYFNSKRKFK
jgi:hypothetical protein